MSRLPDFLIIGAMKAGTTSLWSELNAHPNVFMSPVKEPHSLIEADIGARYAMLAYQRLFSGAKPNQLCGEASTGYSKLPQSLEAIKNAKRYLRPDLKIIYIVRDPVRRAISHHAHLVRMRRAPAIFKEALETHPEIVDYGMYFKQLGPWIDSYGHQALMLVRLEQYEIQPDLVVSALCDFLGIGRQQNVDKRPDARVLNGRDKHLGYRFPIFNGAVESIRKSQAYKAYVRPLMPSAFMQLLKTKFLDNTPPSPTGPTEPEVQSLRKIFADDQALVDKLLCGHHLELEWERSCREHRCATST